MVVIVKVVIVLFLISILISLGSALYYLMMDRGSSKRIVQALTWRIGLSLLLFVFLLFAFAMGWITPHSISMRR